MKRHTRLVEISWFDDDFPKVESVDELHRAVGRLACYGMAYDVESIEDTVTFLTIFPKKDEMVMCKYKSMFPYSYYENGDIKYYGGVSDKFDSLRNDLRGEARPFVIGAILDGATGTWGFHS